MADQKSQTKTFPLANRGIVTKKDPALLQDGQMISSLNIYSLQEGNITNRPGRKYIGQMGNTAISPYKLAKLPMPIQTVPILNATDVNPIVITTEVPHGWHTGLSITILGVVGNTAANGTWKITVTSTTAFSIPTSGNGSYVNGGIAVLQSGDTSIRYVGEGINIWRTLDFYNTFTKVSPTAGVMGGQSPLSNRWSMAPYSAGSTGNPFAFFACHGGMFKDEGSSPYTTLENWGISPALAAASAVNAPGSFTTISGATASGTLIEIADTAHGYTTGQTITITGVLGTVEANGTWVITVVDANDYTLNNSTFVNAYVSGGQAIVSGPDSTQPGASPYQYVYCYRNVGTGNVGNPSPFMVSSLAVQSQNGSITVTVWGSPDTQISTTSGTQSIVIYRSGGSFSDGIYRQIGYVTNPGVSSGVPQSATFVDTTPDFNLLYANQVQYDNNPPVPSTLRYPINTTISSGSPGLSPGWNTITLSTGINNILTIGSSMIVGSLSASSSNDLETCIVADLPHPESTGANTTALVYFQLQHSAGEPVIIDYIEGSPASICCSAFDNIFVCDDPNNPQTLYQSKTGYPESFPIIDALGNSHSINVGTPSNGIQNICEFRGSLLCMNLNNLYTVDVFQGIMYGPYDTPAERGLCTQWAWCKSENVVYYLAWDGIWSWDGSQSKKITEAIDPIFHGIVVNGIYPVDYTNVQYCRMEYFKNQVFFMYRDTDSGTAFNKILRYDILYDRWTPEVHYPTASGMGPVSFNEFMVERDTDFFMFIRTDPNGGVISQYDVQGTFGYSDEYTDSGGLNGAILFCGFQTAFLRPEDFTRIKLFQDVLLELESLGSGQIGQIGILYDYATSSAPIDTFFVNPTPARSTIPLPLQLSGTPALPAGKEAFAVSVTVGWNASSIATFYSIGFRYIDREAVQSGMPSDWLNLGTNNDKRLYQLHLEHNTNGALVKYHLDIRYGINGTQQQDDVQIFQLQSSEKTTVTLPISEASFPNNLTICKAVRLRAEYNLAAEDPYQTAPGNIFRIWYDYKFDFETLPPDISLFTTYKDFGYPCEKIARNLLIELDTGNVPAAVTVQGDGSNITTFSITSTADDRRRIIPFPITGAVTSQPIAKMYRLTSVPGSGGKCQIYNWEIDFTREPCIVTDWDSYENSLGYDAFKMIKQVWLQYTCASPINFTILTDGGALFYTVELPAQPTRETVRFYLPDATGTSPIVLNKSKIYRLELSSTTSSGFKFYLEGSGIEFAPIGVDQRRGYSQLSMSEAIKFRI